MAINQDVFRYFLSAFILLVGGFGVFRVIVRRSYRQHGSLTWTASRFSSWFLPA